MHINFVTVLNHLTDIVIALYDMLLFGLLCQVEEILGEEPSVKEHLFDLLKQYASERDVEHLASSLPEILINEEHQQLIDSIRYQDCSGFFFLFTKMR